jgi:GrpB-like predicted nucleotidyltransferase (UPF0157 family)
VKQPGATVPPERSELAAELGLESGRVRVVPYSTAWPALYAAEAARLASVLESAGVAVRLEHTGSTSIPGLGAKPIVDILAGLEREDDRGAAIIALRGAEYVHRGEQEIPGRDFFRRGNPRQYHVHLTRVGSAFWRDHLAFRDWLRAHPDVAAAYMALKTQLAERYPADREAYIRGKTSFVERVLEVALPDRQA